jgi:Fe-S-cluster containining protein
LAKLGGEPPDDLEDFLDEDGSWQCNACGACCEDISWCLPSWQVEGTTRCKYLLPDRTCKIYEARPWICRMKSFDGWEMRARQVAWGCSYMRKKFYGSTEEPS